MKQKDFEDWKRNWFKYVPQCFDFVCCHEMTSCGVERFCGDCTIYPTWNTAIEKKFKIPTCNDVGCDDCLRNHDCKRRKV